MLVHFVSAGWAPPAEDIATAACRLGRNAYPALVLALADEGLLMPEVAASVVPSAWSAAEFPGAALRQDDWRSLFDRVGYTVDGVPSPRPWDTLRLWRGALPTHRCGWSWTDDRDLAQWFADRPHNRGSGRVWTADVEPGRLLARISEQRPGESEYVVDARGLRSSCGLAAD